MNQHITILRQTRNYVLSLIDGLSLEQLNHVPAGFNNNIIWNAGHLVASQQSICYRRSALPLYISDAFMQAYQPGSKPLKPVSQPEADEIKQFLLSTLEPLQTDYDKGLFQNYTGFDTRYGVPVYTIEEAITFLPYHEGLHAGYIMAMKHAL